MGCYLILSKPRTEFASPQYKGTYRDEPDFPEISGDAQAISLWYRYVEYYESENRGITTELSLEELKYLSQKASTGSEHTYEIVFLSEEAVCPHASVYYGADVAGVGGYSLLGENLFTDNGAQDDPLRHTLTVFNRFFGERRNQYGLFSEQDAALFRNVLTELQALVPGCVEPEDWCVVHVFCVL